MLHEKIRTVLPDFPSEIQSSVAEHEIFMSFINDRDAAIWFEWWHDEGYKVFLEYHKNYER